MKSGHSRIMSWRSWRRRGVRAGMVLVLCGGAVGIAGRAAQTEGEVTRPNILFAIADDWSYGHASAYGSRWVRTPGFDRVAREGLLFRRAYTPNAKCAPSRAIILTGRNSWQLKEAANHICYFPVEYKSWMEVLGERGYVTGHTQKGWGPGVARTAEGKSRALTGPAFNARKTAPPAAHISNNNYAGNFEAFLDSVPQGQPWSFWYGAIEPHRFYEEGVGRRKAGKKTGDIDRVPAYWPDNEAVREDLLDYAFEVEHFDRHLERMLGELDKRGLLHHTLVVATSDHGMPFPRAKGQAYDVSHHVPLAIRWPAGIRQPGRIIEDYVSFVDLAPTFLEAAGLPWAESGMAASPGRSLSDIFQSSQGGQVNPRRDHVLLGKERHDIGRPEDAGYPIRGIVKGDLLYLHNFETNRWPAGNPETGYLNCDGGVTKSVILEAHRAEAGDVFWALCFGKRPAEELYDLSTDPDCVRNLAGLLDWQSRQAELREQLWAELKEQEDPRMSGQGRIFDEYPYANPAQRGFYERFMRGEKIATGWVNPTDFEKSVE